MRPYRGLAVIGVALLLSLASQQQALPAEQASQAGAQTELRDQLIALEKGSWEAWQKRDGAYFDRFLSADHIEVGADGIGGKDMIVKFVGSPVCVVHDYAVDKFTLTMFTKDVALLTYHAEQNTVCGSQKVKVPSPAWASSLYVYRDGKWQNALYQQSAKLPK